MRFTYKAMDGAGFAKDGILEASSIDDALRVLFERGYRPLDLKAEAAPSATLALSSAGSGASKIRHSDVVGLIRELATLLSSGVGLAEAFTTLEEASNHSGLRDSLAKLSSSVHGGEGFSVALRHAGLVLPEYVHALARAGEATGDIGGALQRSADQLEFDEKMRNEAKEALTYPTILILTGIAAITFVFSFVVPRFATLLKGKAVDLPLLSEIVLRTGVFVNAHAFWVAGALAASVALGVMLLKNPKFNTIMVSVLAHLPVFSTWLEGAETARWTSILAVLVKSRVPILLAIELAAASVRLPSNRARLRSVEDDVRLGKALSAAIEERQMLEGSSLSMLKVGEKSGELSTMLGYISNYTADRHRLLQRRLVSMIEPVSILIIGLVLGLIMVGVVLAMTSLTEVKL